MTFLSQLGNDCHKYRTPEIPGIGVLLICSLLV